MSIYNDTTIYINSFTVKNVVKNLVKNLSKIKVFGDVF